MCTIKTYASLRNLTMVILIDVYEKKNEWEEVTWSIDPKFIIHEVLFFNFAWLMI